MQPRTKINDDGSVEYIPMTPEDLIGRTIIFFKANSGGVNDGEIVKVIDAKQGVLTNLKIKFEHSNPVWKNEFYNIYWNDIELYESSEKPTSVKMYEKGSYVVLLSTCNGNPEVWANQMPVNACYKLNCDSYEDLRGFEVEMDFKKVPNGWDCYPFNRKYDNKLKFRHATNLEREEYDRRGGPYLIAELKRNLPQKPPEYKKGEDLIEEAKRRYPEGTLVRCLHTFSDVWPMRHGMLRYFNDGTDCVGFGTGEGPYILVYRNGKWAESVSVPVVTFEEQLQEAKRRYSIGTIVRCLKFPSNIGRITTYGDDSYGPCSQQIWFSSNGVRMLVYEKGIWAEIIPEVPTPRPFSDEVLRERLPELTSSINRKRSRLITISASVNLPSDKISVLKKRKNS